MDPVGYFDGMKLISWRTNSVSGYCSLGSTRHPPITSTDRSGQLIHHVLLTADIGEEEELRYGTFHDFDEQYLLYCYYYTYL